MKEIQVPVSANVEKLIKKMEKADKAVASGFDKIEKRTVAFGRKFDAGISGASGFLNTLKDALDDTSQSQGTWSRQMTGSVSVLKSLVGGATDVVDTYTQVRGVMMKVGEGVTSVNKIIGKLSPAASASLGRIGRSMIGVLGPIGLVTAAVVGVGVAIHRDLDGSAAVVSKISNKFAELANRSETVKKVYATLKQGASVLDNIGQAISNAIVLDSAAPAKDNGNKVAAEFTRGMIEGMISRKQDIVDGLPEITVEDVRNSKIWKGIEFIGDRLQNAYRNIFGDSYESVLAEMSQGFQNAITNDNTPLEQLRFEIDNTRERLQNLYLQGDIPGAKRLKADLSTLKKRMKEVQEFSDGKQLKIQTPMEMLQKEIMTTEALMNNLFIKGDFTGATTAAMKLKELEDKLKNVQRAGELLTRTDSSPIALLPTQDPAPLKLRIDIPGSNIAKIKELRESLKSVQTFEGFQKIQKKIKELTDEASAMAVKVPDRMRAMASKLKQTFSTVGDVFDDIGQSLKDAFPDFAASQITNLFSGVDHGAIAQLNDELREQQRIVSDTSASREAREAAKQRIKLIQEEIKAEKQKGNVLLQGAKLVIDTAKQVIQAALATAIAKAIDGEASKGLVGLITAGVAVAGISALFASKVPALAGGGSVSRPNTVLVGEYPNAPLNPEYIAPADMMQGHMRGALTDVLDARSPVGSPTQTSRPILQPIQEPGPKTIYISGMLESEIRGDDLYQMVKIQHENELKTTGVNPLTQEA